VEEEEEWVEEEEGGVDIEYRERESRSYIEKRIERHSA